MKRHFGLVLVLITSTAIAQQQSITPHLGYAYPAGGRQGETIDVKVGGQYLTGATRILLSDGNVSATITEYERPLNGKELQDIRDKLEAAAKKLGVTARGGPAQMARVAKEAGIDEKDLKRFIEFGRQRSDPKRQQNPQLVESLTLKVSIGTNARPGMAMLRVLTPVGLSNPICFYVGQNVEVNEVEPNDSDPDRIDRTMPFTINGQIMPGDEDAFTFALRKGQPTMITAVTRGITPYLADAVPGWFQAHLSLRDPKGNEIAYADHNEYKQDPVLRFTPQQDGDYTLSIRDVIYRGREDFVYRINVGPATQPAKVLLPAPDSTEKEPNNTPKQATPIALPTIVNGSIGQPGDVDVYRFKGNAGDKLVAEITARRAGSPLDSSITITDATGKIVAYNDDYDDKAAGLITHQADSYASFALPASGVYYASVRDTQTQGGPEYRYSLRLGRAQPDFELRVVPSSVTVRPGVCTPVTVYALRKDGFNGDIALQLKDAPSSFSISGGLIPAGSDKVRITLSSSGGRGEPVPLVLEGSAQIGGRTISCFAEPSEDMMQAFAYRHLVPVSDWLVYAVGRNARAGVSFKAPDQPLQVPSSGVTKLRLVGPGRLFADSMSFELSDAPAGLSIKSVTGIEGALIIELQADPSKLKPGTKGNLIVDVFTERTNALAKRANAKKTLVGCLPAISFVVVK